MTSKMTIGLLLTAALGIAMAEVPSACAQSTLGGARNQQNRIGGVAKPAPVVGGASVRAYAPPPPKPPTPAINLANRPGAPGPGSVGAVRPLGQTVGNTSPHPVFTPPNKMKTNTVVGSSPTLKCSGGACMARGVRR